MRRCEMQMPFLAARPPSRMQFERSAARHVVPALKPSWKGSGYAWGAILLLWSHRDCGVICSCGAAFSSSLDAWPHPRQLPRSRLSPPGTSAALSDRPTRSPRGFQSWRPKSGSWIVLQEIVSEEQVQAAAEALGLPHWAVSDFSPPTRITKNPYASLEVAVLSRTPLARAAEWDTTGRAAPGDGYPPRTSSSRVTTEELEIPLPMDALPRGASCAWRR